MKVQNDGLGRGFWTSERGFSDLREKVSECHGIGRDGLSGLRTLVGTVGYFGIADFSWHGGIFRDCGL